MIIKNKVIILILICLLNTNLVFSAGYNASFGQSLSLDGLGDYVEFGPSPGDLVAHWDFDGNLSDASGNSNNLSYQGLGSDSYLSGHDGQALSLDGSEYVSVVDAPEFNFDAKMMVSASFSTDYSANPQTIMSQWEVTDNQRSWLIRLTTDGRLEFLATDNGVFGGADRLHVRSSIDSLNDGNFHRFAILWGAGNFDLFVDGVEDTNLSYVYPDNEITSFYDSSGVIAIGGRPDGVQSFNGEIDDVQLYNGGRVHVSEYLSDNPGNIMSDLLGDLPESLNFLDDTQGAISFWFYSDVDVIEGGDHGAMFSHGGNDTPFRTTAGFGVNFRRTDEYTVGQKLYLYQGNENGEDASAWITSWSLINSEDTMLKEKWYHFVLNSDGNTWTLYLDGVEVPFENNSGWLDNHGDWFGDTEFLAGSDVFSIGARLYRVWGGVPPHLTWWDGNIDDFRIYDDSLPAPEIASLYNGENVSDGMLAYWDFNGDANDKSGNGQHGFLRGDADFSAFQIQIPIVTFDNDFSDWESGDVTVNYNLIDNELDTINISQTATSGIEYSVDGTLWFDATDAGGLSDGYTSLSSGILPGEDNVFVWGSSTDLADTEDSTVYIRIRPNDGTNDADDWVLSEAFSFDNKAPSSVSEPTFGTVTSSSIVINKPDTVTENGSGLNEWRVRRDSLTELSFSDVSETQITDSLLLENTEYVYDVMFADIQENNSSYGQTASKYTLANTPTNLNASLIQDDSVTVSVDEFLNDEEGLSAYYFENVTTAENSGWIQENSWQDVGLEPGTEYEYIVKYRNGEGVETSTITINQSTSDSGAPSEPAPRSTSTSSGSRMFVNYGCRDPLASNHSQFSVHNQFLCIYATQINTLETNIENTTCDKISTLVRFGSRGEDVKKLQATLNNLGFSSGVVDGIFGKMTDFAVKEFQKMNNLIADGIVGPITRSVINSVCK